MSSAAGGGAKLWGGRFTGRTDPLMEKFNNSIGFDRRLWRADIDGSIAYAQALHACKLLTKEESTQLVDGLWKVGGPRCPVPAFTRNTARRRAAHTTGGALTASAGC